MRFVSQRPFLVLGVATIGATLVAARDAGEAGTAVDRPAALTRLAATYGMRVAPIQL